MFILFFCVEIVSCFNSCAGFFSFFPEVPFYRESRSETHWCFVTWRNFRWNWQTEVSSNHALQQMDLGEIIGSFKFHPFVNFTLLPAAHQCLPEPTEKPAAQQGSWITENSLAELPPLQNGGILHRQWVLSGFPILEASFFFFLIACWGLGPHENTHTPCFTSV